MSWTRSWSLTPGPLTDQMILRLSLGARVIHHPWRDDFAEARNVALDAAEGRWILYIDADERLSPTIARLSSNYLTAHVRWRSGCCCDPI